MRHLWKQLPVFVLAAIFMAASALPSFAVEKKDKKQSSDKKQTTQVEQKKVAPKKSAVKSSSGHKKSLNNRAAVHKQAIKPKRFDKFIDKNKNGIDDRKENLREKKPVVKKDTSKKPTEKKK